MAEDVVLVATGTDRPGVMDELSQFLMECGANITESRSIKLRGQFALLLELRADPAAVEVIRAGVGRFAEMGIEARLNSTTPAALPGQSTFPYTFTATGTDQAGVLYRVSHLMRVLNVNIDDIQTRVADDNAFRLRLVLSIPRETPVAMLRDYLTYLCKEINITGELTEA